VHLQTDHPTDFPRQQDRGYSYSRTANPTVAALEAKVAGLEG
ncbi:unnamed protein product, partial [Scytosiphon promiscuus]